VCNDTPGISLQKPTWADLPISYPLTPFPTPGDTRGTYTRSRHWLVNRVSPELKVLGYPFLFLLNQAPSFSLIIQRQALSTPPLPPPALHHRPHLYFREAWDAPSHNLIAHQYTPKHTANPKHRFRRALSNFNHPPAQAPCKILPHAAGFSLVLRRSRNLYPGVEILIEAKFPGPFSLRKTVATPLTS